MSKISPLIRWLQIKDYKYLQAIDSSLTLKKIADEIKQKNWMGLVAEFEGAIVGLVIYHINDAVIEIKRVGVLPQLRRMGIGSTIIGTLKERLSWDGRIYIRCEVSEYNEGAHYFLAANELRALEVLRGEHEDRYVFGYMYKPDEVELQCSENS